MLFHKPQKQIEPPIVTLDGQTIETVDSFNYLGIRLDTALTFKNHVQTLTGSIARTIGAINGIKKAVPKKVLIQIYNTHIHSKLCYGILVWGQKASMLSKIQKRAISAITDSKYNAHTQPLFKKLNILQIEDTYKLHLYKFLHKIFNENTSLYFQNIEISKSEDFHDHDTRSKSKYCNTFHRLALTDNCIKDKLIKILNITDQNITSKFTTHSIGGFAKYIKNQIIENYQTTCNKENCYICQLQTSQ